MIQIGKNYFTWVCTYVHVLYIFCNLVFSVVDCLCAKYPTAIIEEQNSVAVLKSIEASSDKDLVEEWKEQEAFAQARRNSDPSAMDIYDLKVSNGNYIYMNKDHSNDNSEAPSKADVELSLLNEEFVHTIKGAPTIISEGLKLEEQQCVHSYWSLWSCS